jgi:hypothetical protein
MSVGKLEEVVNSYGNTNLPYRIPAAFARHVPRVTIMKEIHELRRAAMESYKVSGGNSSGDTIPSMYEFLQDLDFVWPEDVSRQQFILE